jgi:hypothetical protein
MAEKKGFRLKVHPRGGQLHELIGCTRDDKGRRIGGTPRTFQPGETFLHDDVVRAKQLLGIQPSIVVESTDLTEEEKIQKEAEQKAIAGQLSKSFEEKAKEFLKNKELTLAKLGETLRKSKPEDVRKEAEKRGITFTAETPAPEDMVAQILEDEGRKIDATLTR